MRLSRAALLVAILAVSTAGMNGGAPTDRQSVNNIVEITSATRWGKGKDVLDTRKAGILGRGARGRGASALLILDCGSLMCPALAPGQVNDFGAKSRDSLLEAVKDSIRGVPVYILPGDKDWITGGVGSDGYDTTRTRADSLDPLWSLRAAVSNPNMDRYGNFSFYRGAAKYICVANVVDTLGEVCVVGRDAGKYGTALPAAYWPTTDYPRWAVPGSPVWRWVSTEISNSTASFTFICLNKNLYHLVGRTTHTTWGQHQSTVTVGDTLTFGDMIETKTTARGFRVTAVISGSERAAWVIGPLRNDSLVTYASGGVYYINVPASGGYTIGADSVGPTGWGGNTIASPDTCRRYGAGGTDSVALWQDYNMVPGNMLVKFDAFKDTTRFGSTSCSPGRLVVDPSYLQCQLSLVDSTGKVVWPSPYLSPR